jgi:uncharacterized membrane protein YhaH (DUF805 family)
MNWIELFTSIEGRISRQPFWIAFVCLLIPELIAMYVLGNRWNSVLSLVLTYPNFAVLAKRGHDRNVPTWVPGIVVAASIALDVLALLNLLGTTENPNTLFYVIGIPMGLMALILIIDFGFRRGTVGPNRYGADPLEGTA